MKILKICILAVMCWAHLMPTAWAEFRNDRDYFLGEIKNVNTKENTITIFDYIDETKRVFVVERGVGEDLKPGTEVMVTVEKGTNAAKRVKLIVPRSLKI